MGGWLRKARVEGEARVVVFACASPEARSLNFDVRQARPGRDCGSMGKAVSLKCGELCHIECGELQNLKVRL